MVTSGYYLVVIMWKSRL